MKTKKALSAIIASLILLCIASGAVYLRKNYVEIEGRICKSDIKKISPNLKYTKIKEINRCTEVEVMYLSGASENDISSFADFKKLSTLLLSFSSVNSSDSKKMNTFSNLQELDIHCTDIDLEGFNNSNLSDLIMSLSEIKNFDSLAECLSLRKVTIADVVVDDNIIRSDGNYTMKDSGFLSSFDNVTELKIYVDSIEDVSGICEMASLESLSVSEGTISDEAIDQLEEKGIKVTQEKNND